MPVASAYASQPVAFQFQDPMYDFMSCSSLLSKARTIRVAQRGERLVPVREAAPRIML
jgi:hypothetical protein